MKQIPIKNIINTMFFSSLLIGAGAYADGQCTTGAETLVSGRIVNNLQASGEFGTLGVVALRVDNAKKMKCGLVGIAVEPPPPEQPSEPSSAVIADIAFTHTLSCDDNLEVDVGFGPERVHSQLTLDTVGQLEGDFCNGVDADNGLFGTFVEYSSPQIVEGFSTGRGLFAGVIEGEIDIEGSINCLGSVDMKFDGYICLPE